MAACIALLTAAAVTLFAAALATAPAVSAAELRPWSVPYAEPLRLASLPLELADGSDMASGEWEIALTPGYFNLWSGSWHTATIHQELGLEGEPLTPEELRILEQRHPGDDIHRFDVEGVITELRLARGLGHGMTLTVSMPWVEIGSPHWDAISEEIHSALGWGVGGREVFAHSQTLAYVWDPKEGRAIEGWDELEGSGVGDVRLALSGRLGAAWGGEHRWIAAVEAPTGDTGTIAGSGGWDAGVRWFATWRWRTRSLVAGAGYTWLDRSGNLLGLERADTWHLIASFEQDLGKGWGATGSFTYESSPLADLTSTALGDGAAYLRLGVLAHVSERSWVALDMGQDWYGTGMSPDYAFRLTFGTGSRPRP